MQAAWHMKKTEKLEEHLALYDLAVGWSATQAGGILICANRRAMSRKGVCVSHCAPWEHSLLSEQHHSVKDMETNSASSGEEGKRDTGGELQRGRSGRTFRCCQQGWGGCVERDGPLHLTPRALISSAHQPSGRVPDHPPPGILCQPGRPTHLGSKLLPTHSVLRAVRFILVPPVQVQLRGIVAGPKALDVHVLGQFQLHCRERRGSLQSPGQLSTV